MSWWSILLQWRRILTIALPWGRHLWHSCREKGAPSTSRRGQFQILAVLVPVNVVGWQSPLHPMPLKVWAMCCLLCCKLTYVFVGIMATTPRRMKALFKVIKEEMEASPFGGTTLQADDVASFLKSMNIECSMAEVNQILSYSSAVCSVFCLVSVLHPAWAFSCAAVMPRCCAIRCDAVPCHAMSCEVTRSGIAPLQPNSHRSLTTTRNLVNFMHVAWSTLDKEGLQPLAWLSTAYQRYPYRGVISLRVRYFRWKAGFQ